MNTIFIFFSVYYLVHSSVIQALQCYTGSNTVGIPWFVRSSAEYEQFETRQHAQIEKEFPLIECDSRFSQCFKVSHGCQIADAYYLIKGCALPEGNRTCVLVIPDTCRESDMKYIKCEMCGDKNGCNKEEWQNGNGGKTESSPSTTTPNNDVIITDMPDHASANVYAAMNNTFVCITAFLFTLFPGILCTRFF